MCEAGQGTVRLFRCCHHNRRAFVPFSCLCFPFFLFVAFDLVDAFFFLSTIARKPLSYLLTISAAELFRLAKPGTHTFSKSVNLEELIRFFAIPLTESSQPRISRVYAHGLPMRIEAGVR
jgi:hypothetical protein